MNNQPHVNQPHEPVHVAVRLLFKSLVYLSREASWRVIGFWLLKSSKPFE